MRHRFWILLAACSCFLSLRASCEEWRVFWGDLHAHSALSDGQGTPQQAYEYASRQCDFLALTEHNHQLDEGKLAELVECSQTTPENFVRLYGQEFSTLKGGNHVNVFNAAECIPGAMNSNYRKLYSEWLPDYQARHPNEMLVCQFNHPASQMKDYGIAQIGKTGNYAGDWNGFVHDADRWVRLIAILNGPGCHTSGQHNAHGDTPEPDVNAWLHYLDRGMHLSPTCNQDTHVDSWGDLTTDRTGVWIQGELGSKSLLKALKEGCCFATEDKDLSVWFTLNGQPMGTELADMGTTELSLCVTLQDNDEPQSSYQVEIYQDEAGDGQLAQPIAEQALNCGEPFVFAVSHKSGTQELFFAHITQTDENDDVDDAWTAPVYIGPGKAEVDDTAAEQPAKARAEESLVGSRKSSVYHYASCSSVKSIKPENLVRYASAPEDKQLHKGCPVR